MFRSAVQYSRIAVALLAGAADACSSEAAMLARFSPELRAVRTELQAVQSALAALEPLPAGQTAPQLGYQHLQLKVPPPVSPWVQLDFGRPERFDRIVLVPAQVDYRTGNRGPYNFPRRFRVDASNDRTFAVFQPLLVQTESDFELPGLAPLSADVAGIEARYLRLTVTRLAEENGWHSFALAEFMALRGDINVAHGAGVSVSSGPSLPPRWHKDYLVDGRTPLGPPIRRAPLAEFDALFAAATRREPVPWMAVDLGEMRQVEEVRLHPLHSWQGADMPGFRFPLRFRVEAGARADFADARVLAESPPEDFANPGNNPVTLRGAAVAGRHVRVLALKPVPGDRAEFALSEMEIYSDGRNVALGRAATTSDYGERPAAARRPPALLTDGLTSLGRLTGLREWLDEWRRRSELETRRAELETRLPALETRARLRAGIGAGAAALLGILGIAGFSFLARRRRQREQLAFRQKLAQDLHDEIGSNLAAIAVISETAAIKAGAGSGELGEIHRIARESADAMREVLWLVGARQEGGGDLAEHLRLAAARMLPRSEVRWLALPESVPAAWPVEMRHQIFLFFKEALTNVARHARAARVDLSARIGADAFELTVADDGRGFEPGATPGGLGLKGLRERAAALGGTATIVSAPGRGTTVMLRVPLPRAQSA